MDVCLDVATSSHKYSLSKIFQVTITLSVNSLPKHVLKWLIYAWNIWENIRPWRRVYIPRRFSTIRKHGKYCRCLGVGCHARPWNAYLGDGGDGVMGMGHESRRKMYRSQLLGFGYNEGEGAIVSGLWSIESGWPGLSPNEPDNLGFFGEGEDLVLCMLDWFLSNTKL